MNYRFASFRDVDLLAELNEQLIQDELSRNRMSHSDLRERMVTWLKGPYQAVFFEETGTVVAYALFRRDEDTVYVRQFFVLRPQRRRGIGRQAMEILRRNVFPRDAAITLDVLVHNESALKFWRAIGFHDYAITMECRADAPLNAV